MELFRANVTVGLGEPVQGKKCVALSMTLPETGGMAVAYMDRTEACAYAASLVYWAKLVGPDAKSSKAPGPEEWELTGAALHSVRVELAEAKSALEANQKAWGRAQEEMQDLRDKLASTQRALDDERSMHQRDLDGLWQASVGQAWGQLTPKGHEVAKAIDRLFTNASYFEGLWKKSGSPSPGSPSPQPVQQAKDEHVERHAFLHKAIDELVANYMLCTGRRMGNSTVEDLVTWSHKQTLNPTEHRAVEPAPEGLKGWCFAAGPRQMLYANSDTLQEVIEGGQRYTVVTGVCLSTSAGGRFDTVLDVLPIDPNATFRCAGCGLVWPVSHGAGDDSPALCDPCANWKHEENRVRALRSTLIDVGRAIGASLSDSVSDEFLQGLVGEATTCQTTIEVLRERVKERDEVLNALTQDARKLGWDLQVNGSLGQWMHNRHDLVRQLDEKLREARADVVAAAGELLLPVPEPGTNMAKALAAITIMRRERDTAREIIRLSRKLVDGQFFLVRPCDTNTPDQDKIFDQWVHAVVETRK